MSPHWQFHRGARHVNYVSNYILGTTSKTQAEQTQLLQQIIRKKRATERGGLFHCPDGGERFMCVHLYQTLLYTLNMYNLLHVNYTSNEA